MSHHHQTCEVCGERARCAIADQKEMLPVPGEPWKQWERHSLHWFCDKHKRRPMYFTADGSVLEREK